MAIDFPDSPSNNDIYTVNGKRWIYSNGKWSIYGSTAPDATASDTEPTGVGDGHIWYRSDESQTLIRYDNTWVEVGSAGGFDSSSTNFPTSLDSATGFAAVEALQAKVGADSSAVTTSLDYKVAQLEAASTGKILQVVSTTKTDTFSSSLAAGADTAITGLSATITPSDTSSKILVVVHGYGSDLTDALARFAFRVYRGGTEIGSATGAGSRSAVMGGTYLNVSSTVDVVPASQTYLDSPATTSATTYAVHIVNVQSATRTVAVNRSAHDANSVAYLRTTSSITLMEVSA